MERQIFLITNSQL